MWKPGLLTGDQATGFHLSARIQALDRDSEVREVPEPGVDWAL